jgi:eukaryotic-like serine/threonine-protein kinase
MNSENRDAKVIFGEALRLSVPAARAAYLDQACAGDLVLRQEVESLLSAYAQAGHFLDQTHHLPTPDLLIECTGMMIGRYKLLEKIGEGGFGVVYMAEQREPVQRKVALKIIKAGMDTKEVIARFEAERQALALMDHPNISQVLDGGATEAGRPYFVMELVNGIPITDYCDQKNLPTAERLQLFMKVCHAVQHAHQKGIIHRDLKPTNVLVTLHDGEPVPKVIDFGVAKALGQKLTEKTLFTAFQQMIGTPAYMSPEQAELSGLDIDTRSDIYSLGALLYELLTGVTPFAKETLAKAALDEIRRMIRDTEPLKPSTRLRTLGDGLAEVAKCRHAEPAALNRLVRGDLDWIVMKCLEKDRKRRYETADGLAADLERHFQNEPVVARPPSKTYKIQKFVRRNRGSVTAVAAVAFVLVLGGVVSAWQWRQAVIARRGEAQQRHQAEERAIAEASAKTEANRQRERAEAALSQMEIQRAEDFFKADDSRTALAYLAHVLRRDSSNLIAAERLMSALTHRSFPLQLAPALQSTGRVTFAQFSPDGQRVLAASEDDTARMWEARLWDARTGQPLTEPLKHNGRVRMAQFSPDGRRVVTASLDNTARIWDAQTGQPLTEPLEHDGPVYSAQFSRDGQRVVTASRTNTARVWDARTGQPLTEALKHNGPVESAQFSRDGRRVVTASAGTVRVWDARSGRLLTDQPLIDLDHNGGVGPAQFSPDGKLVTVSGPKAARVWDARTGQPLTEPLSHKDLIRSVEFSPDRQWVVTASDDHTARVWDARTGHPLTEPMEHHGPVGFAQFSPDGQRVVTASKDDTARVWDARTGEPLTEPLRHNGQVNSVQFSPDGQWVVTASDDDTARVWDVRSGQALARVLRPNGLVTSSNFLPDGQWVVTVSGGGNSVRLWDGRTGQPLTQPLRHHALVRSVRFSPDGRRVVTVSTDNTARVWDVRTGQLLTEPLEHKNYVSDAQFSPDGQRVMTASADGTARVWDARTGQMLTGPLEHKAWVISAQFSPDGRRVVTASASTVRVWNARTGQPLTEPLRHNGPVNSVEFSPDGYWLVTASEDKTAQIWDAQTGQPLTEPLKHDGPVYSAQFSPDGQRVVTASDTKSARVWDARTGEPLTEPLRHNGRVQRAHFSSDGQRVVTASDDHTARVWDARTGQPLTEPLKHNSPVSDAQFSPDGQWVATLSLGETTRLWEVPLARSPLPTWLLQLVEAVAGERIWLLGQATNHLSGPESEPVRQLARLKRQVAGLPAGEYYARWAQWFFADRTTRAISPNSPITVGEYVQRQTQEDRLEGLLEAVLVSPTNGLTLARLAQLRLAANPTQEPEALGQAECYARHALELSPQEPGCWAVRAKVLERTGSANEALQAFSQAIDLAKGREDGNGPTLTQALLSRGNLLRRLERVSEAQVDFIRAGIRPRASDTGPSLIDLTSHYNVALTQTWYGSASGSDLSELPQGVQKIGGIEFDVRGLIQVGGQAVSGEPYPKQVRGIAVHRRCQRLHFLHAAINAADAPHGKEIGHYLVHYPHGGFNLIPLLIGRELGDWFEQPLEPPARWEVAWTGTNELSRAQGRKIRLFKTTWENPSPGNVVETVDIEDVVALFVVAITSEP